MWKESKQLQSSFLQLETLSKRQNNSSKTRRYECLYYLSSKTKTDINFMQVYIHASGILAYGNIAE